MKELKIMNMKQVAFYISKGVQPRRIDVGHRGKIVFIYDVESTHDLVLCQDLVQVKMRFSSS